MVSFRKLPWFSLESSSFTRNHYFFAAPTNPIKIFYLYPPQPTNLTKPQANIYRFYVVVNLLTVIIWGYTKPFLEMYSCVCVCVCVCECVCVCSSDLDAPVPSHPLKPVNPVTAILCVH